MFASARSLRAPSPLARSFKYVHATRRRMYATGPQRQGAPSAGAETSHTSDATSTDASPAKVKAQRDVFPELTHGSSQGGQGGPEQSIWTAPQSLLSPTAPQRRRPFDPKRAEVFFRRATQPDKFTGPPPAMWQRYVVVGAGLSSVVVGVYLLVWGNFGEREHVFSGVSGCEENVETLERGQV